MDDSSSVTLDSDMGSNIFKGKLVRLTVELPEVDAKAASRWTRDSEYSRLLDTEQAELWSAKKIQKWREEDLESDSIDNQFFNIRALDDDTVIGFIGLSDIHWGHGEAWVGIGIGDRAYWGKGYGTDAMQVLLRYAFTELNLHRISLGVFEYNQRAIRSYEKAGFVHEGREREFLHRDGSRADALLMGILRSEWERGE